MTLPRRRRPLLALLVPLLALALAHTASARAEACPGSGIAPACPYASAAIVGQRAESILRFPEAVALDAAGDVYVADQLSYVVQKFNAAGTYLGEWGSYGGGHGQFGPIGGLATDAAGNVYVVDSSHNRIEKFTSDGEFLTAWGHTGSGLGPVQVRVLPELHPAPGRGHRGGGRIRLCRRLGQQPHRALQPLRRRTAAMGHEGRRCGAVLLPARRRRKRGEVLVADDDNHRIERFSPTGEYQGSVGSYGTGPGQFGFPYGVTLDAAGDVYVADDINHRIVKLNPALGYVGEWGGFGSGPTQLAFPRALAADPAGDTYVADTANDRVQVFDPAAPTCARSAPPRTCPARSSPRAGWLSIPPVGCW